MLHGGHPGGVDDAPHLSMSLYLTTTGFTHSMGSWYWKETPNLTLRPSLDTHVASLMSALIWVLGNLIRNEAGGTR